MTRHRIQLLAGALLAFGTVVVVIRSLARNPWK